jgi:tripartite-type tricarboxylate transporter receptor subunit TctC
MRHPGSGVRPLFVGVMACIGLVAVDSKAQSYPAKPIRLVVGYTTGGPTDVTARMVAQKLSEHLGQPVIVENRAGASGTLGKDRVATSPADGYTLLVMSSGDAIVQALLAKAPRDLELGFAPVSLAATGTYVLVVHPSVPARNVKELVALARAHPGKLTYGSSGVGSSVHLAGELLNMKARLSMVHVPYKSSADSARATASGEVELSFPGVPGALPFLHANKIRALAVTSMKRVPMMASTPTLDESGVPGYDRYGWYGVLAPLGVPKDVVARLNAAMLEVVNTPEMKAALNNQGLEPHTNTPEQFGAFIQREIAENAKLIKLIGLKAE